MYTNTSVDDLRFDWDVANTTHIARHNVARQEVEEVFANDPMDLEADVLDSEERYMSIGHTSKMRVLVLVWTMRAGAIRPITAFDASGRLSRRYLEQKGL